jgi:thiol-disulfide isomerase/thioredoxin
MPRFYVLYVEFSRPYKCRLKQRAEKGDFVTLPHGRGSVTSYSRLIPSVQMRSRAALVIVALALPVFAIRPPKDAAPRFHAKSMDGENFTNDSVKGKVVLVQFWATWCQFCRRDQPAVDEIAREFAPRGLVLLAVNVGESKKKVQRFLEDSPRSGKIVLNDDTNLPAMFATRSFPLYVLIDRDGNIAGTQNGAGGGGALRRLLKKAELE